jgi:hypothetical protein
LVCSDQYWQTHQHHMHAHCAEYLTLIDTESHLPLFRYFLDALQVDELWDFFLFFTNVIIFYHILILIS